MDATPADPFLFQDLTNFSGEPRYYRVVAIDSGNNESQPSNREFTYGTAIDSTVGGAELLTAVPDANGVLLKWPSLRVKPYYRVSRWGYHAGFEEYRWLEVGEVWATTSPAPARDFMQQFYDPTPLAAGGAEYRVQGFDYSPFEPPAFPYAVSTWGFVHAKRLSPMNENRGRVLLVVEDKFTSLLSTELDRFRSDLVGDGWTVHGTVLAVSATESVTSVKQKIADAYAASGGQIKAAILIGHVPVPRSGNGLDQGDGHNANVKPPEAVLHIGAWVADSYYGDMSTYAAGSGWTDTTVNVTQASSAVRDPENENTPGDGKFDQRFIPSAIELQVGRIDFAKLSNSISQVQAQYAAAHPTLPPMSPTQAEASLLSRYFQRNHDYRMRNFAASRTAKIDSNVGLPGTDFLRFAGTLFGSSSVSHKEYHTTVTGSEVLSWTYLGGSGNHDQVNPNSVAHTLGLFGDPGHYDLPAIHSVFNQFRGSWMGDWDRAPTTSPHTVNETFMNAILAHPGEALASVWSGITGNGFSEWYMQRMGSGGTLGESYLDSMNDSAKYDVGASSYVSRSILGDPTLRLHVVAPVSDVFVEHYAEMPLQFYDVVSWSPSPDPEVIGYNIYAASTADGPFTRLNATPVTSLSYSHTRTSGAAPVFMVRAVKLEATPSGTYFNGSTGILAQEMGGGGGNMMLSPGGASMMSGSFTFGGFTSASIFDDLFDTEGDDPTGDVEAGLQSGGQSGAGSTSGPQAGGQSVYTGPVIVFGFAPMQDATRQIEVTLPIAANVPGRRVELFDVTTNRLLSRKDVASVGQDGVTLAISNLPAGTAVKVRISGLNGGNAPISAAARTVSSGGGNVM